MIRFPSIWLFLLLGLWVFDQWLTDDRSIGWERNSVRNSLDRWENPDRFTVAVLGSSTSRDWMSFSRVEKVLKLKRGSIVDAHINGCHQGCTWASVRRMLQRRRIKRCRFRGKERCLPPKKRRFTHLFFGTNLFQMCEDDHSKRILQHQMLLPTQDVPTLFQIYFSSQKPMRQIARFLGDGLIGAYGDTRAVQSYWKTRWLGQGRRGSEHRWYRIHTLPKSTEVMSCDYHPHKIALKKAFTEALFDDFKLLADQSYLMLLPDRSRSLQDPLHQSRWTKHLQLHRDLLKKRPWIKLIDLTQGGVSQAHHFRDGFHLKREFFKLQQKRFEEQLLHLNSSSTGKK